MSSYSKKNLDYLQNEALKLLNESELSNYQICKDTGISEPSIGNYRGGKRKPNSSNSKILISVLGNGSVDSIVNQNNVEGDNIHGTNVTVNKTQTDKLIEMIKTRDVQISKGQEQIDRLIGIIEKLNNI